MPVAEPWAGMQLFVQDDTLRLIQNAVRLERSPLSKPMVNFVATTSWIRGKMCKIFHPAKSVKTVLLSGIPPSMMRDVSRYSDLSRQHTKELYVGITPGPHV
jgi:hypothetical protein